MTTTKIIYTAVKCFFLWVTLLIVGCRTNDNITFYSPDKSPRQVAMDEADCRNMARGANTGVLLGLGGGAALVSGIMANNNMVDTYRDCMISKGYLMTTNAQKPVVSAAIKK